MEGRVLYLVIVCAQVLAAVAAAGGVLRPPAIYVFGDSRWTSATTTTCRGRTSPGRTSPTTASTSRAPSPPDASATATTPPTTSNMGFTSSPPAYLSMSRSTGVLSRTALATGVSYASGGAGILDSTNAGNNIPLSKQVQYFNATRSLMVAKLGSPGAVSRRVAKSVFLISVGSNDIFVFYAASQNKSAAAAAAAADHGSDAAAFIASLVSHYSATIKELYMMGARKFAIINAGLLGCIPEARMHDARGSCLDALNQLASGFDDALGDLLAGLAPALPGFTYSLADYYGFTQIVFEDPGQVGYTDVAGACCGGGRLGAEAGCTPSSTVCADRDQHAFWDRVHPSQRACMDTAIMFYHNRPGRWTTPMDFKELAETGL
ncbi:hypothetical protein ACP70R_018954 [Stipagrostis hirtigluma subsp. patula]